MEDLAHWLKNYMILSIFAYNNNNINNKGGGGVGGKKRKKEEKSNNDKFCFCLTFCKHDWQNKTMVTRQK